MSRRDKFLSVTWPLKRQSGPYVPDGQWYVQVGKTDSNMVEVCPSNWDDTMNVYTMTRRDARLLAKRIIQMLDKTK
jgi:hypothetical protein